MSFLKPAAGAGGATGAANGLGNLIGADPSRISSIANSIGTAANGIATAGGAAQGYAAPNNYMQMADPNSLAAILAKFRLPQPNFGSTPLSPTGPNLQQLSASLPGYAQ